MKSKIFFLFLLIANLVIVYSQEPNYTTEKAENGMMIIICPTENDALLLLNGNYNLPDTYFLLVLLRGIYFNENPGLGGLYILQGTKLVGGPLGVGCREFYNLNRNTDYYVLWKYEVSQEMTKFNRRVLVFCPKQV